MGVLFRTLFLETELITLKDETGATTSKQDYPALRGLCHLGMETYF